MKILLIEYGTIKQTEYITELTNTLQEQKCEVDVKESFLDGLPSIYTVSYHAVLLIIKGRISDEKGLSSCLKHIKEGLQTKIVVISDEKNIMKLEGHLFLPGEVKAEFILKNLDEAAFDEKGQTLIKVDEGLFIDKDGTEHSFTRTESKILEVLLENQNKILSREEILKISGYESEDSTRKIDVHMKKIRDKLNTDNIRTIRGIGYKWME